MQDSAAVRILNDALRKTMTGGQLLLTQGIASRSDSFEIIRTVQRYADFTPDNDPHGEHDFGSFKMGTNVIFWKIDYYDLTMEAGSPDPTNPAVTKRVLTIMLAEEY